MERFLFDDFQRHSGQPCILRHHHFKLLQLTYRFVYTVQYNETNLERNIGKLWENRSAPIEKPYSRHRPFWVIKSHRNLQLNMGVQRNGPIFDGQKVSCQGMSRPWFTNGLCDLFLRKTQYSILFNIVQHY